MDGWLFLFGPLTPVENIRWKHTDTHRVTLANNLMCLWFTYFSFLDCSSSSSSPNLIAPSIIITHISSQNQQQQQWQVNKCRESERLEVNCSHLRLQRCPHHDSFHKAYSHLQRINRQSQMYLLVPSPVFILHVPTNSSSFFFHPCCCRCCGHHHHHHQTNWLSGCCDSYCVSNFSTISWWICVWLIFEWYMNYNFCSTNGKWRWRCQCQWWRRWRWCLMSFGHEKIFDPSKSKRGKIK